ncbi:hypothetical protein BHE74_00015057, partial [Ensete ventricosum]
MPKSLVDDSNCVVHSKTVLNNSVSTSQMKSCNNISTRSELGGGGTIVCIRLTVVYGGVKMVHINIIDGCKLLVKPGGIIALLDEACYDDKAACQKILDKIGLKGYQVEEAKSTVIKEREAARKAIEAALPIIKENPVLVQDTEKIDSLNAEIENLKDLSPGAPNSRELQNDDKPQKSLNEKQQYAGSAWGELKHIRQAVGFL